MSGFGADTDYFGFADTNVKLVSSSATPGTSEAQASDSLGTISASTIYNSVTEYSATYRSCSDTAFIFYDTATAVDFRLGKVISNIVLTGVDVVTSNTERPEVTMTGRTCTTTDGNVGKYDYSTYLEIAGTRKATPIGASADTGNKVTGSSASATVSVAEQLDSQGAFACLDVYAGRVESSVDVVGTTADPAATTDTASGWVQSAATSNDQENTGYATGTVSQFINLARA